jgi:IS30 family transposase
MPPLTLTQRYQIEHCIRQGMNNRRIAAALFCTERVLRYELERCGGRGQYHAEAAQADRRRCAQNSAANHPTILETVWRALENAVARKDSPEQAIHALKLDASTSATYRYLHRCGKRHLLTHLRHYKASQKRGGKTGKMDWVYRALSVHDRSKDVLTRDTIGHLECDSIVGKRNEPHKIVVLIDRALRYVRLGWVPDGTAAAVARHMARWEHDDSGIPILTLTTDQGVEFSALPERLPGRLYACDPGKPYQKGQVEHMNKLIRQYIPKGMSLRNMTQTKLNWIANELNQRPRKRLGWLSPAKLLSNLTTAPTC